MTLLDAPKFDAARDQRRTMILRISAVGLLVLFVALWLVAGRPVDSTSATINAFQDPILTCTSTGGSDDRG